MESRPRFFENFDPNFDSYEIIGEQLPNEPSNYRFVNGVLLPPTPVISQPTPTLVNSQPMQKELQQQTSMEAQNMSFISQTTPISLAHVQKTSTVQGNLVPLVPEPTVIVNDQFPQSSSTVIFNNFTPAPLLQPRVPFGTSKMENSSNLSQIFPPIGVVQPKNTTNAKPKDRFGKTKLDIDAYVKFLLREKEIEPGVNILSYEDPKGTKHKASLLPKGPIQADKPGGPVFQRLHFWIKDLNGYPRRSKQAAIGNEMRRIKYMGTPLSRLIEDYEYEHPLEPQQNREMKENEASSQNLIENTSINDTSSSFNDDNNENDETDDSNAAALSPPKTVKQPNFIQLVPGKKKTLLEKLYERKANAMQRLKKKEGALKMIRRLNSDKIKAGGNYRI